MSLPSTLPTEERASERVSHFPKATRLEMAEPGLETQGHVGGQVSIYKLGRTHCSPYSGDAPAPLPALALPRDYTS